MFLMLWKLPQFDSLVLEGFAFLFFNYKISLYLLGGDATFISSIDAKKSEIEIINGR